MSNSSFPSDAMKFGGALGALLVAGVGLQWWQYGFSLLVLVWLVAALCVLIVWRYAIWHGQSATSMRCTGYDARCGPR